MSPPALSGYGVYDPVRQRMITVNPGSQSNESWGFFTMGTMHWEDLPAEPMPAQTLGAAIVYDALRDRLLMFGGEENGTFFDHTWEFSLASQAGWTLLTPDTPERPPARRGSAAAYDAAHDRLIVFGGVAGPGQDIGDWFEDTWALSLSGTVSWEQISSELPAGFGREGAVAVYDPGRDRFVVHGGYGPEPYDEVWALSLEGAPTWTLVAEGGPVPRKDHRVIYDGVADRLLLLFGQGLYWQGYLGDVWALPLAGGGWSQLASGPAGRTSAACAVDPVNNRLLVYGGFRINQLLSDAWSLSLDGVPSWTEIPLRPAPRVRGVTAYDSNHDRMILFGGHFQAGAAGDVWSYSLAGLPHWTRHAPGGTEPPLRSDHAAVFDAPRDRMLVFGGYGATHLGDLWALRETQGGLVWEAIDAGPGPGARASHTLIYDEPRDRVLLFGGVGPSGRRNDVWELTLSGTPAWHPLSPTGTPPNPRYDHSAIYDPIGDRMIVYGGTATFEMADTWALELGGSPRWVQLPSGPANARHTAIFDPGGHRMIAHGNTGGLGDVWELSLFGPPVWVRLTGSGVSAYDHSAIYDPENDRMLTFGSFGFRALNWNRELTGVPPGAAVTFALHGAHPHPARGTAWVSFTLPDRQPARLELFDAAGRRMGAREVGSLGAGRHRLDLGAGTLESGVYWARLTRGNASQASKIVVID